MTAVVAREINASTPDMRDGHSKEHGDPVSSSSSNGAAAAAVSDRYADESYKLFSRIQVTDPTADEGRRIRNKLIWRIAPLSCIGYFLMFTDKQTLGSSSILGILSDAHLNSNQYNWLTSIFYFGYMLAEFPQNWALQRFPVAKWLAGNLFVCFASLFVVRFLLGLAEACVLPSLLLILSMFFTYQEQGVLMSIVWAIGNASPIASGLLSYAVLWIDTRGFAPWKWLMVITGIATIVYGVAVLFLLPDSPLYARFLTPEERGQAVLRIKENRSGIEQKHFKKEQYEPVPCFPPPTPPCPRQLCCSGSDADLFYAWGTYRFIEAMKDPKSWLFAAHALTQEMGNGTANQYLLLINSFGFSVLQTTLLGCVNGVVGFVAMMLCIVVLLNTKARAAPFPPRQLLLMACARTAGRGCPSPGLPSSNRWGLVAGIWLRSAVGVPYCTVMVWAANASAGHTKKTAVIALYHIGYGIGNIISPQLFRPQWSVSAVLPPPWWWLRCADAVAAAGGKTGYECQADRSSREPQVTAVTPAAIVVALRVYLSRENARRDALEAAHRVTEHGVIIAHGGEVVVDCNQLDLTDRQNLRFRYVL
ncbi:Major facilitator superfamily domain, general substrate transporter [Moelleriella libera RCEF 2490]|uniref:Major facilitator superfamily domain, general substrate transporter n=1 Tax=Moelleriella libera RCEF 2490 TaxID=1081109 RepID=A0A168AUJ5_9HYPO|nr:Major facilitator superfamily domain, general substrate transporter [Moelleriella libera RCEF 2490]